MGRSQVDVAATALVAVLACGAAASGAPAAAMIVLGIMLIAAPGYLLGQLLVGSRTAGLERVVVMTGLALAVPVLGGLLLYAAGVPLHRPGWLGLLAGVTLAADTALFARRRAAAAGRADRPTTQVRTVPSGSAPGEEGKSVVSELIYSACGVVGVSVGTCGVASAMTGAGSVLDIDWSGDIAALMVGGICLNSSTRTSRSMVFLKSSVAFLNSPRALPRVRPISGRRRGPKTMSATTKMSRSSGKPRVPNMTTEPSFPRNEAVNTPAVVNTPPYNDV